MNPTRERNLNSKHWGMNCNSGSSAYVNHLQLGKSWCKRSHGRWSSQSSQSYDGSIGTKCSLRTIAYKNTPELQTAETFKNSHTSGNSLNSKSKKVVAVARHSIDRVLNVTRRLSLDIREAIGRSQTKKGQSSTPSQTNS